MLVAGLRAGELAGQVVDRHRSLACRRAGRGPAPARSRARRRGSPRSERRPCPRPRAGARACGARDRRGRGAPPPAGRWRHAAATTVSSGSAPTTTASGPGSTCVGAPLLRQDQRDPVQPEPEPDPGRRLAAQELDQPVVAATAADRLLLALATGHVVLERRPRVVVEAADEPWLDAPRDADRGQVRLDGLEVRAHASHSRSVIRGAAALSSVIAGSLESSSRSALRSRRSRSVGGSASTWPR